MIPSLPNLSSQFYILIFCVLLGGCATVFKGSTDAVTISSNPSGAIVRINGQQKGQTPITFELESNRDHSFSILKDGFKDETAFVSHSTAAGYVVLDVLFIWWLVPIIVDAATGNWNSLDQRHVHVTLIPLKTP